MQVENHGSYRIVRYRRYGKDCKMDSQWFEIEQWEEGWLRNRWKPWMHIGYGGLGDSCRCRTKFKTQADADRALKRHLSGLPRNDVKHTVVRTVTT